MFLLSLLMVGHCSPLIRWIDDLCHYYLAVEGRCDTAERISRHLEAPRAVLSPVEPLLLSISS